MAKPVPPAPGSRRNSNTASEEASKLSSPVVAVSLLQPRVAVVLGVPERWHPFLFACRLLSTAPAFWWGLRLALRFLITELLLWHASYKKKSTGILEGRQAGSSQLDAAASTLRLTETALAVIWCAASAYLAFFFTDCLMSRWLLNYTPQATIIRLLTMCAIYTSTTSWSVYLSGGGEDPSLLLPAWVCIASTLTLCYHVSQRKINIRKETSASISVFSIASFTSMVVLLLYLHLTRADEPNVPLFDLIKKGVAIAARFGVKILGITRDKDDL